MGKLGISPSILSKADPRILRAARFIDNHPLRITGGESQLARRVGLSVSQLSRLFVRDLGISPQRYADSRRLEKGRQLLHLNRHSIKEVAAELGFSSLPHFSAWFRRMEGMSPPEYLKSLDG